MCVEPHVDCTCKRLTSVLHSCTLAATPLCLTHPPTRPPTQHTTRPPTHPPNTAVSDALAGTVENWRLLQQHAQAELAMRELDMQVQGVGLGVGSVLEMCVWVCVCRWVGCELEVCVGVWVESVS